MLSENPQLAWQCWGHEGDSEGHITCKLLPPQPLPRKGYSLETGRLRVLESLLLLGNTLRCRLELHGGCPLGMGHTPGPQWLFTRLGWSLEVLATLVWVISH